MNKYTPSYSTKFRQNRRMLIKRGLDMSKLERTIDLLLTGEPLPPNYRDHALKGNYIGYRECHIEGAGDWLLVYKVENDQLVLVFTSTGTHADLFK